LPEVLEAYLETGEYDYFVKVATEGYERFLREHDLSVTEGAEALGVTHQSLSLLINGRTSLTPVMALRIEKAFGPSMDHLMRMQLAYDLAQARQRSASIKVARYRKAARGVQPS
jgi:addiction module HigA family antidote